MEIKLDCEPRGFMRGEFKDYYDKACHIQESSICYPPCIWLGCSEPEPKRFINGKWVSFDLPPETITNTCMHINQEQAAALIPLLQLFVETGQLRNEQSNT